jgi:hypothetical protein
MPSSYPRTRGNGRSIPLPSVSDKHLVLLSLALMAMLLFTVNTGLLSQGKPGAAMTAGPYPITGTGISRQGYPEEMVPRTTRLFPDCRARLTTAQEQIWVVDTAIVRSTTDTTRETYLYNSKGLMTLDLTEGWRNGKWVNLKRFTDTYDPAGDLLSYLGEVWVNGQWVNEGRSTFTYDPHGNRLSGLGERWTDGRWVNYVRDTRTYDFKNHQLSWLHEGWMNGQWVNEFRNMCTYDFNGHLLSDVWDEWLEGELVRSDRTTYTYDSTGNLLASFYEHWAGELLLDSERSTYTWDYDGNLLSQLIEQRWTNGQWEYASHFTFTYDSRGNRLSELEERWSNGVWVNSCRTTYGYDSNEHLLLWLYEQWQGGHWVAEWRYTTIYDHSGNQLSTLYEQWESQQLVDGWRSTCTYDSHRNLSCASYIKWQNSSWVPANGYFSFSDTAGNFFQYDGYDINLRYKPIVTDVEVETNNIPAAYSLSQNYPNPFNPSTTIEFTLPRSSYVTLKVYDILGREVVSLVDAVQEPGYKSVRFDGTRLASGVYFYRIEVGNFVATKKLLLLR